MFFSRLFSRIAQFVDSGATLEASLLAALFSVLTD